MKKILYNVTKEIARRTLYVVVGTIDIGLYVIGGKELKDLWIDKLSKLVDDSNENKA